MNTLDDTPHLDGEVPHVVVGVDGTEENAGALRYAAREAAASGAVLDLVHVVPDDRPVSSLLARTPADLTETGRAVLDAATVRAETIDPALEIRGTLRHGTRPAELLRVAERAELLVVGRDRHPLLERLLRGDTATGVAARAEVPVVQVPAEWDGDAHGAVLAGVKGPQHAAGMLADAFAVARERAARLVVLHAWKLPSVYDDIIEARVDLEEWQRDATLELEALLREWRVEHPGVLVETRVVHDHAAHALIEASRSVDLVTIVRRAHGVPAAAHLGTTARALLRAAHCPVRVVAPTDR